jgi:hypothetical protein
MSSSSLRGRDGSILALLGLIAAGFVGTALWNRTGPPSYDIYAAHYPNAIYALNAIRQGHGLLWNSLQNCGQPFLPSTLVGPFYPPNWLLLVLDLDLAFRLLAVLHMWIGGIGAYLLGRELGVGRVAAICGAICFEIGGTAVNLAVWLPSCILGIFIWMPWALLLTERILRNPTPRRGAALGVVFALQVLGAYPQIFLFTCQVVVLRVGWEIATRRPLPYVRIATALAVAFFLAGTLGAVQLLPMAEFARESIRSGSLSAAEIRPSRRWTWAAFRSMAVARGTGHGTILTLLPLTLGIASLLRSERRRVAVFYAGITALYVGLSFDGPLLSFYQQLPMGRTFREPIRFLWVSGFTVGVVVALGVEALRSSIAGRRRLVMAGAVPLTGVAAFYLLSGSWPRPWEWLVLGSLALWVVLSGESTRAARLDWVIPLVLATTLGIVNANPFLAFLPSGEVLRAHQTAFEAVRQRMTLQDRAYAFGRHPDYSLMPKTPQLFGVRSISDYEPQTSRRLAQLQVMWLLGTPMQTINQFLFPLTRTPRNRPILNLLATRYFLVDQKNGETLKLLGGPPPVPLAEHNGLSLYENTEALRRAYFVPRLQVLRDSEEQVRLLSSAAHDPRRVALVEEWPADGFIGTEGAGTGVVDISEDLSERLRLRVSAPQEGFVVLTDQDYPGWQATVNGQTIPILRANVAFRAMRVPAGESTIELRYRPRSVYLGAVITIATLVFVIATTAIRRSAGTRASAD